MAVAKPQETKDPLKIIVISSGFVFIGRMTEDRANDKLFITDSRNIRVWGTTEGLGELRKGPTSSTKLDVTGDLEVPRHSLLFTMDVDQKAWAKK